MGKLVEFIKEQKSGNEQERPPELTCVRTGLVAGIAVTSLGGLLLWKMSSRDDASSRRDGQENTIQIDNQKGHVRSIPTVLGCTSDSVLRLFERIRWIRVKHSRSPYWPLTNLL